MYWCWHDVKRIFIFLDLLLANNRISYNLITINLVGNHTNVEKASHRDIITGSLWEALCKAVISL